ncbi:MAG: alpha/beta hydrolase, partial [Planctomycetota bacterium]|nr:alpha/beta hydrolase [Planctomycetota bacterium]
MKIHIALLLFLLAFTHIALAASPAPATPQPILPGGIVVPLYPPTSRHLKQDKLHEVEKINSTLKHKSDTTRSVLNIHNPSIEVHRAKDDATNTGTALIIAPGGGHGILWVGPEGTDFIPQLQKHGITTIILRNRLRSDGYEPTTDAVNDAFQAIRQVRAHAAEWKLDPAKIGILGFSAGAELSSATALD